MVPKFLLYDITEFF